MKRVLPFIAIISIAAFAGNMINIGLSYGVHWKSLKSIEFMEVFAIDFPLLLAPTAATLLPAFISTLILFFISKKNSSTKKYWFYSLMSLLVINVITVAYFLPLNLDFVNQKIVPLEVEGKLNSWLIFHWLRIILAICSAVFAIKALKKIIK